VWRYKVEAPMDDNQLALCKELLEKLVRRMKALQTRVGRQEGDIKGLEGRVDEL
jgi:hypothetical protein